MKFANICLMLYRSNIDIYESEWLISIFYILFDLTENCRVIIALPLLFYIFSWQFLLMSWQEETTRFTCNNLNILTLERVFKLDWRKREIIYNKKKINRQLFDTILIVFLLLYFNWLVKFIIDNSNFFAK